jgi:hypothetical protein
VNQQTCSRCGAGLAPEARFCAACGHAAPAAPPPAAFCWSCGQPLAPSARFCAGCGAQAAATQAAVAPLPAPSPEASSLTEPKMSESSDAVGNVIVKILSKLISVFVFKRYPD